MPVCIEWHKPSCGFNSQSSSLTIALNQFLTFTLVDSYFGNTPYSSGLQVIYLEQFTHIKGWWLSIPETLLSRRENISNTNIDRAIACSAAASGQSLRKYCHPLSELQQFLGLIRLQSWLRYLFWLITLRSSRTQGAQSSISSSGDLQRMFRFDKWIIVSLISSGTTRKHSYLGSIRPYTVCQRGIYHVFFFFLCLPLYSCLHIIAPVALFCLLQPKQPSIELSAFISNALCMCIRRVPWYEYEVGKAQRPLNVISCFLPKMKSFSLSYTLHLSIIIWAYVSQ